MRIVCKGAPVLIVQDRLCAQCDVVHALVAWEPNHAAAHKVCVVHLLVKPWPLMFHVLLHPVSACLVFCNTVCLRWAGEVMRNDLK